MRYVGTIARNALALACMLVLACLLASCGPDALTTTQQTKDSSSATAASQSAESQASAEVPDDAIQVVVTIDSSNAHEYNNKFPESLGTFTVNVPEGSTVLDALEATGVDYAMRGRNYVSSIGGIEDKVCGRDSGWEYLVDDVLVPKSANECVLSGGENVRWAYTVVEGDVQVE